jgi:ABC-type polysaccharide/polyol phosphate transport system ATPase subunit
MSTIVANQLHKTFRLMHGRHGTLKGVLLSGGRVKYENVTALDHVTFTVDAGETLAVIGRNGSGKSTMLGIMARVYKPTSGSITMNGRVSALLDLGAGFHPDLTGIENIFLNGSILGMSRREITGKMDDIIAYAELEQFIDAPIRTYSKGMVMRLGFSIATQVDPDILLVDEVLAVGDEAFQHKCYDKVREFQKAGKTIIFVSHDLKAVAEVASRIIWLDAGTIRADGAVETVLSEYIENSARREEGASI